MKKKLISVGLALVLVLSLGLVTAVPVAANDTIYVGPAPLYETIQEAIDAAEPGDTIVVQNGVYTEDVSVNKTLTLQGAQAGVCAVGGRDGEESELIGSIKVISPTENVTIDGFTITGTGAGPLAGVCMRVECTNAVVVNNIVNAVEATGGYTYSGLIDFSGITNASVLCNSFSGAYEDDRAPNVIRLGITGDGTVTVANNEMHEVGGGGGIGIMCTTEAAVINVLENDIDHCGDGVWVWSDPSSFDVLYIAGNRICHNNACHGVPCQNIDTGVKLVGTIFGTVVIEDNEFCDNQIQVDNSAGAVDLDQVMADNALDCRVFVDRPGSSLLPVLYGKIQSAVYAATSGDTVLVLEGYYDEAVIVDEQDITVRGESLGVVVDGGFWLQADYAVIDGMTIQNGFLRPGGSFKYAACTTTTTGPLYPTMGHAITNNDLYGDYTGIKTIAIGDGPDGSDDLYIEGNLIHGWRIGIGLSGVSSGHQIRGNDIYENLKSGIELGKVGDSTIELNQIHDNAVNGIALFADNGYGGGITIQFNDFARNGATTGLVNDPSNPTAYAPLNWWDDISGPYNADSNPSGIGDAVSDKVNYIPWLTRDAQTVIEDNIAYFGFPMVHLCDGWNMLSTPIALDPACDTWQEYITLGNGLSIDPEATTYYFDGETQWYGQVLGDYQLKPCDAIIVRMLEADMAAICWSPEMSVPSKDLVAGWNLVSLSSMDSMPAKAGLRSVEEVGGGLKGYTQVISPAMCQYPWHYLGAAPESPPMLPTKGYWVLMLNPGTLGGFEFTPKTLGD